MINNTTSPVAALAASQGRGPGPRPYIPPKQLGDMRDSMSAIIGNGYNDMKDPNAKNAFSQLQMSLGRETATRLLFHMAQFNQRPDMLKLGAEEKLRRFYSMGSNDPELHNIITRAGQLGTGPVAAANSTWDVLNQQVTGRDALKKAAVTSDPRSADLLKKAITSINP
jgi:hypothetical protein